MDKEIFYDVFSNRYFTMPFDEFVEHIHRINQYIYEHRYCTLNDVYSELGLNTINVANHIEFTDRLNVILELTEDMTSGTEVLRVFIR